MSESHATYTGAMGGQAHVLTRVSASRSTVAPCAARVGPTSGSVEYPHRMAVSQLSYKIQENTQMEGKVTCLVHLIARTSAVKSPTRLSYGLLKHFNSSMYAIELLLDDKMQRNELGAEMEKWCCHRMPEPKGSQCLSNNYSNYSK